MKTDYERAYDLDANAGEIELEYDLAKLLHPNFSMSYSENGHYWYMNDLRKPMPNFEGYVPKWLRDNGAVFQLMIEHKVHPVRTKEGYAVYRKNAEEYLVHETFEDCANDPMFKGMSNSVQELRELTARVAIIKAVIELLSEKAKISKIK